MRRLRSCRGVELAHILATAFAAACAIPGVVHATSTDQPPYVDGEGIKGYALYESGPSHRAFAVSRSGAWGWSAARPSAEVAIRDAIAACARHTEERCELFSLDAVVTAHSRTIQSALANITDGDTATLAGRLDEAVRRYEAGLDAFRSVLGEDSRDAAAVLLRLAAVDLLRNRGEAAQAMLNRAEEIRSQRPGADHVDLGDHLTAVAGVLVDRDRLEEAAELSFRSLESTVRVRGVEDPKSIERIRQLAGIRLRQDRPSDAARVLEAGIELIEKNSGPDANALAALLLDLAAAHDATADRDSAATVGARALTLAERHLGAGDRQLVQFLSPHARRLAAGGNFAEAGRLWQRAIGLFDGASGEESIARADLLEQRAEFYGLQHRYAQMEADAREALAIRRQVQGSVPAALVRPYEVIAYAVARLGRRDEALRLQRDAVSMQRLASGERSVATARRLFKLGRLAADSGLYTEAEQTLLAALEIADAQQPRAAALAGDVMAGLARIYSGQERLSEARALLTKAIATLESALGSDAVEVMDLVREMAELSGFSGNDEQAEALLRRALTTGEKVHGPGSLQLEGTLMDLGWFLSDHARYAEAQEVFDRIATIYRNSVGQDNPFYAGVLTNNALFHMVHKQLGEAEGRLQEALKLLEGAQLGSDVGLHVTLRLLGTTLMMQRKYDAAEPIRARVAGILRDAAAATPEYASAVAELSEVTWYVGEDLGDERRLIRSLELSREALALRGRYASGTDRQRFGVSSGPSRDEGGVFAAHATLLARLAERWPHRRAEFTAEAFEAMQLDRSASVTSALTRMSARFAAGTGELAALVRAYQDAGERLQQVNARILAAAELPRDQRDEKVDSNLAAQLAAVDGELAVFDARLSRDFPEYRALASPRPLALAAAQAMLGDDEGLLVLHQGSRDDLLMWVLRRDRVDMQRLPITASEAGRQVAVLRSRLDPVENAALAPFPLAPAWDLYRRVVAPAATLLIGVRHLIVVPGGPLHSLPLGVLLTEMPERETDDSRRYHDLPWLIRRYALTTIPSVASLHVLRTLPRQQRAPLAFAGIGDPILSGPPGATRALAGKVVFDGALADVEVVRQLPPLRDGAIELMSMGRAQGVGPEHLYLRERASEALLRTIPLDRYRVIAFATHGLLAGDIRNLKEPALVLTPPPRATPEDDGLLTASEIAQLKLNADWIILSACNTAGGDGRPGGESLSGLAKAFFYAGSRALLVSHWPVVSEAAVALTTRAFAELAKEPGIGRAEALRRSMLALLDGPPRPDFAHPLVWAPFVVVGEGGAGR